MAKNSNRNTSTVTHGRLDGINNVVVSGQNLTIADVVNVAQYGANVRLTDDEQVLQRVQASSDYIREAVENHEPIYGVTTGFGGMSGVVIPAADANELQNHLIWAHKTGTGLRLPNADVRAGMLLRANSFMIGISGIRLSFIRRIETFLNAGVTPHVYQLGSIGASGDLVPLSYIAGALTGLNAGYKVDFKGEEIDSIDALKRLDLPRMSLGPKEGLAIMNGTSLMTGIAANCVHEAQVLMSLTIGSHALILQGLAATNQSFHPFIHKHKAHPGQVWAAAQMLELLEGSKLIRDELDGRHDHRNNGPIQDRYSMRCLPQYLGPIIENLWNIEGQIKTEINSATDNPLIDAENKASYHCGNFLGQYVGVSMDQLRHSIGLMAKHLDVQIAFLVAPEFNNGLPASLVGNAGRGINMGLKGLQLTANSIMPLLTFYGNSLVDRFPTHAEQFNQNINSQGFGAANLTRQSIELYRHYVAISLMFAVQAVDLRTYLISGQYDARPHLSPTCLELYENFKEVIGQPPSAERPYIWNDDKQALDDHITKILFDIVNNGRILQGVKNVLSNFTKKTTR